MTETTSEPDIQTLEIYEKLKQFQAVVFYEKPLTSSDSNGAGRVVIPKQVAHAHFPHFQDHTPQLIPAIDTEGAQYDLRFRYWVNGSSRMYLLEGLSDLHRKFKLGTGDVMIFARLGDGSLLLAGRQGTKDDIIKKVPRHGRGETRHREYSENYSDQRAESAKKKRRTAVGKTPRGVVLFPGDGEAEKHWSNLKEFIHDRVSFIPQSDWATLIDLIDKVENMNCPHVSQQEYDILKDDLKQFRQVSLDPVGGYLMRRAFMLSTPSATNVTKTTQNLSDAIQSPVEVPIRLSEVLQSPVEVPIRLSTTPQGFSVTQITQNMPEENPTLIQVPLPASTTTQVFNTTNIVQNLSEAIPSPIEAGPQQPAVLRTAQESADLSTMPQLLSVTQICSEAVPSSVDVPSGSS